MLGPGRLLQYLSACKTASLTGLTYRLEEEEEACNKLTRNSTRISFQKCKKKKKKSKRESDLVKSTGLKRMDTRSPQRWQVRSTAQSDFSQCNRSRFACCPVGIFQGILDGSNSSGHDILCWSAPSLDNAPVQVNEGWFGHEVRVFKQLESPGQHLVQKGKWGMGCVVNDAGKARSRTGLNVLILFPEGLENGPDKYQKHLLIRMGDEVGGEEGEGVDAGIPDEGVGIPEALDNAGDHLGEVRKDERVVEPGGECGHQPDALLSDGALLL